jgi:hypothetical protein
MTATEIAALMQGIAPVIREYVNRTAAPVLERLAAIEARLGDDAATRAELSALRERLAVTEVRAQVPGPAGRDGRDGTNGADGFSLGDLVITTQTDRKVELAFRRGDETTPIGAITLPVMLYKGVHQDGKLYERGDVTTWAGSMFHCQETTTAKPGEGSRAWVLCVKRGRDGKDLRTQELGVPVVAAATPKGRM